MVSSIESIPLSIFHKHGLAVSVCSFLILCGVGPLELQLQAVGDEGDEFGICRFALGVADGVAEEALEVVQVAPVPGHFDGMPNGALDSRGRGLECFRHLGVQYLGDGVSLACGQQEGVAGAIQKGKICE